MEIIAVYSKRNTKHIRTLCWQNAGTLVFYLVLLQNVPAHI